MDTTQIQCPHCQKLINSQAVFCEYCGRKIIQKDISQNKSQIDTPHKKKRAFYNKASVAIGVVLGSTFPYFYIRDCAGWGIMPNLGTLIFEFALGVLLYSTLAAVIIWIIGKIGSALRKK